jgi:hypothetical protein
MYMKKSSAFLAVLTAMISGIAIGMLFSFDGNRERRQKILGQGSRVKLRRFRDLPTLVD